jgi:hypothetical protein
VTQPRGHENKQTIQNAIRMVTIKGRTNPVGNICLSNRPTEADVLLTHVCSFEIQPTDLLQLAKLEYTHNHTV